MGERLHLQLLEICMTFLVMEKLLQAYPDLFLLNGVHRNISHINSACFKASHSFFYLFNINIWWQRFILK